MKLPISFALRDKGKFFIKMITIALKTNEMERMGASISEANAEKAAMLAKLKNCLIND